MMKKILTKKIKYRFFLKICKKISGFVNSVLKYQNLFKLEAQKFNFPKYKKGPFLKI